MKFNVRLSLFTLVLSTGLLATGCSSGASSPEPPAPSIDTEIAGEQAPPATPEVQRGPGWEPSLVLPEAIPTKWEGGAGWQISMQPSVVMSSKLFGFKKAVGVLTQAPNKTPILTTYDKNGNEVAISPPITDLASDEISLPEAHYVWSNGKQYLMILQLGQLVPDPSSTKKTGEGVIFISFDADTGELVKSGTVNLGNETGILIPGGIDISGAAAHILIDPVTGETSRIEGEDWDSRVDGVDIFHIAGGSISGAGVTSGPNWSIPSSKLSVKGANDTMFFGPYLSLAHMDGNEQQCTVIDVHTGQEAAWFTPLKPAGTNDLCMADLGLVNGRVEDKSPYHGVIAMYLENSQGGENRVYVHAESGKSVTIGKDDTFGGAYVGADGIVYGMSEAVSGAKVPSYLDIAEGEAKTLGPEGIMFPLAVSGEGTAIFRTAKGLAFLNPVE